MLNIKTLVVGSLHTNCYIISEGGEGVIIDPGDDAEYIINTLRDFNITPRAILATHAHFDHVLAVNELKMALQIPFLLSPADQDLLTHVRKSAQHFTGFDPGPSPTADGSIKPGQDVSIGRHKLDCLAAPGHTPGGLIFFSPKEKMAWVGDLIFADGRVGRTDYSYSSSKDLLASIARVERKFRSFTIFPGHGESFVLK